MGGGRFGAARDSPYFQSPADGAVHLALVFALALLPGLPHNKSFATVAVLVYRAFAFWLPTIPGAIAYFQLRKTVHRWTLRRTRELSAAGA